jgi:hypothetical protein
MGCFTFFPFFSVPFFSKKKSNTLFTPHAWGVRVQGAADDTVPLLMSVPGYGSNLAAYIRSIIAQTLNMVPPAETPGRCTNPASSGKSEKGPKGKSSGGRRTRETGPDSLRPAEAEVSDGSIGGTKRDGEDCEAQESCSDVGPLPLMRGWAALRCIQHACSNPDQARL